MKGTICIDFDGVLHSYTSPWKVADIIPDPPTEGAQQFVRDLISREYNVIVCSARCEGSAGLNAVIQYLANNNFPGVEVCAVKPKALLYIDDRGFRFAGDFNDVLIFIDQGLHFKPWNKK